MELSFISLTLIAGFVFWLGWKLRGILLMVKIGSNPEYFMDVLKQIKKLNDEEAMEKAVETTGTELEIERHGDMLYAFAKETNQFIAQAPDLDKLLDEAKKRFPDRKFFGVIDADNPAKELANVR